MQLALPLELDDAGEQDAGLGDEEAAGLEPELEVRVGGAEEAEGVVDGGEVERGLARPFGDAEAAAEVQDAHAGEALGDGAEEEGGLAPGLDGADAAAGVGVEADDADAEVRGQARQFVELVGRDAELGERAGGAHVGVVAAPAAGIEADEDVAAGEEAGPGAQGVQAVDGHPGAHLEGAAVLLGAARSWE